MVQAATETLPVAEPVVWMPAGHEVQVRLLAADHEPAAQVAQPEALVKDQTPVTLLLPRLPPAPE